MKMVLVVGSVLGQRNAVGYRFSHIVKKLTSDSDVICHSNLIRDSKASFFCFPAGRFIFRGLNFFRTRMGIDLSRQSAWIFAVFAYTLIVRRCDPYNTKICITASEYLLVKWLTSRKFRVYVDLPTTPWQLVRDKWPGVSTQELTLESQFDTILRDYHVSIIPPSDFIYSRLTRLPNLKASILKPVLFGLDKSEKVTVKRDLKFLFVGNICFRKGFDILIQALEGGLLKGGDLTVCGRVQADIRADFYEALARHGFAYLGYCSASEVLNRAEFLVLPSRREGCAKVIGEAIMHGVIPLTTPEAGWRLNSMVNRSLVMAYPNVESFRQVAELASDIDEVTREWLVESLTDEYSAQTWSNYGMEYLARLEL